MMGCCINMACVFCALSVLIGLASLVQLCLGLYFSVIQPDIIAINSLVKTDQYDSYLYYVLLFFIGLGAITLLLSLLSIYGTARRFKSLTLFIAVLWVRHCPISRTYLNLPVLSFR